MLHSQTRQLQKCILSRILLNNKITIVKPPIRDPDDKKDEYWVLKHTLYGLRHSPWHWYTRIYFILTQLILCKNASDPCLLTGQVVDPLYPAVPATSLPLTLDLYIDNIVYFSKDPAVEQKFEALLSQIITVEFMGTVKWFLGTHFQWLITDGIVTVHHSQMGFSTHLVEDNNIHTLYVTPNATPNCSGLPIDAILNLDKANNCPALIEQKRNIKESLAPLDGSRRVLARTLLPYTPSLDYCSKLSKSHWNAALYALHYIHSTID